MLSPMREQSLIPGPPLSCCVALPGAEALAICKLQADFGKTCAFMREVFAFIKVVNPFGENSHGVKTYRLCGPAKTNLGLPFRYASCRRTCTRCLLWPLSFASNFEESSEHRGEDVRPSS